MPENKEQKQKQETNERKDNVVYVGNKNFGNYILACKHQLFENEELYIKARGKQISRAVDLAEVIKTNGVKDKNFEIKEMSSESIDTKNKNDKDVRISEITIYIK